MKELNRTVDIVARNLESPWRRMPYISVLKLAQRISVVVTPS